MTTRQPRTRLQSHSEPRGKRTHPARRAKIAVTLAAEALRGPGSFVGVIHACRHAARAAGWSEPRIAKLYETLMHGGGGRAGVIKRASRWFAFRDGPV